MIYDLAIIGGGPGGVSAGVYAARKRLKTVIVTKDWTGQSSVSDKIENWIGTVAISGLELSKNLENHVKAYAKDIIDIHEGEGCEKITKKDGYFEIKTNKSLYTSKTILITSGSKRKKIEIPGADKYEHKGLTYCATCDGPMYSEQDVVVIGGGNAAFESTAQLLAYCNTVTLMNRSENFRADPGTIEAIRRNPKAKILTSAIPKEVKGDKFVSSLVYTDAKTNRDIELLTTGIFVEIGAIPNTEFVNEILTLNKTNHIAVDPKDQKTSINGIWAAGDCTDGLYHQNNIAAGDAVKAVEDIYMWLRAR